MTLGVDPESSAASTKFLNLGDDIAVRVRFRNTVSDWHATRAEFPELQLDDV